MLRHTTAVHLLEADVEVNVIRGWLGHVTLDRGGLRRTHLRGRENVQKRYLVHVAGFNLSLVIRALLGAGTPKELATRGDIVFWLIDPAAGLVLLVILPPEPH